MTDVDEGTVTVTMPGSGSETVTISDVRLDLREATAPVTATFSGNANAFVSGVATVISAIEDALEVESAPAQILTRGGTARRPSRLRRRLHPLSRRKRIFC